MSNLRSLLNDDPPPSTPARPAVSQSSTSQPPHSIPAASSQHSHPPVQSPQVPRAPPQPQPHSSQDEHPQARSKRATAVTANGNFGSTGRTNFVRALPYHASHMNMLILASVSNRYRPGVLLLLFFLRRALEPTRQISRIIPMCGRMRWGGMLLRLVSVRKR
jgi:hypothetical protein